MFPSSNKTPRSPTNKTPSVEQPRRGSNSEVVNTKQGSQTTLDAIKITAGSEDHTDPPTIPIQLSVQKLKPTQFLSNQTQNKQPTPPVPQIPPYKPKGPKVEQPVKAPEKQITPNQEKPQAKMNQQQIQQSISSSVPEFSGENQITRTNDLIRFTATADSIYQTLGSDEEKRIFDRLIKLRLTGEAFTRITHRNIEDYPKLRELLNNMYSRTYSLEELERAYLNIQQSYGETIRNYGYRLLEALEQYKTGYQTKYKLKKIDEAYNNHMETNSVQIFKRGLNNTILREKIATSTAKNIDEIINETEIVERMLTTTTDTPISHNLTQNLLPNYPKLVPNYPTRHQQINHHQVTCNYCQRPNHTWDICRVRINQERMRRMATQTPLYSTQRHQDRRYQPPGTYHNSARPEAYNGQYPAPTYQNQQHNRSPAMNTQQNRNHYAPAQYTQVNRYQPKFCSHCKTTTGHTFDECRSKFFTKNPYQLNTKNNPSTDTRELTDKFNNMRINTIYPQSGQNPAPPERHTYQGNSNGSNQQ